MDNYFLKQIESINSVKDHHLKDCNGDVPITGFWVVARDNVQGVYLPWHGTGTCMNMRWPTLVCNVNQVKHWKGKIQEFPDITTLHIYEPVDDLSFIKSFPKLCELYIYGSGCKDWSFLADLVDLEYLVACKCPNFQIHYIKELSLKQRARFEDRKADWDGFGDMGLLDNIMLKYCNISDISALSELGSVSELDLSHNAIKDITPIAKTGAYYLTLRWNQIEDISNLRVKYLLNVRHNNIRTIPKQCVELGRFFIGHNPIERIPDYIKKADYVFSDIGRDC